MYYTYYNQGSELIYALKKKITMQSKLGKYAKLNMKNVIFEIYVFWVIFESNQKLNMHILNKYANALSSEPCTERNIVVEINKLYLLNFDNNIFVKYIIT